MTDIEYIADKLEKSVANRVNALFALLPTNISDENKCLFTHVFESATDITTYAFTEAEYLGCRDYFGGWRRILTPHWRNGYGRWECAYGDGFTWSQFLDYIIESGCTKVWVDIETNTPALAFRDHSGFTQFAIVLSTED